MLLGCGTWVLKYAWPGGIFSETSGLAGWTNTAGGPLQAFVVTAHVATGSLILGSSVWAVLLLFCGAKKSVEHETETEGDAAGSALGVTV